MRSYSRVMLGRKSMFAEACFAGGYIGVDYGLHEDLAGKLPDEWKPFNAAYIPVYLASNPGKSKVVAGLACGAIWTVAKGLRPDDIVLSPDGTGRYRVGEIEGEYYYAEGEPLPHRRTVAWSDRYIAREEMSEQLWRSMTSWLTVCNISPYATELEKLVGSVGRPVIVSTDESIEDPLAFAMEKHLEDFLVSNWAQTELGREFDIFTEGDVFGQQYPTDTGPIDILAKSKDGKRLLVVELKKGRASDRVVGQVLRYMGFVKGELAEADETVEGAIIALEDDQGIRRALSMVSTVAFYRYQVSFKLSRG